MDDIKEIKLVVSDLHMGTGTRSGQPNPYEDFHRDDRFAEMVRHYSIGEYVGVPIEIIIDGDFMDLLKVAHRGRFVTEVTEDISLEKVRRCILGHPGVFDALAEFVSVPNHDLTYIAGNHDLDVAFPLVQEMIRARLGVRDQLDRLRFLTDREFYRLPGGVVVTHGHMFEEINRTKGGIPLRTLDDGRTVINMPWGSLFFSNVLAPVKAERQIVDLVNPLSSFILWGLVFDLRFTLKILFSMVRFFVETRLKTIYVRHMDVIRTLQILGEELALHNKVERRASRLLRKGDDITALIVGHSHNAKVRRYPHNKIYVNTGTWVQRVSLDLRELGTSNRLTFAEVAYGVTGPPVVRLMRWRGEMRKSEELVA